MDSARIPDGFKLLQDVSENVLPASKRPVGTKWYYCVKRQLFWSLVDKKLYVFDPFTKLPHEFQEPITSDIRISVGTCKSLEALQCRHVIIKDLTKVSQSLGVSFDHLDKPCSYYALFEGHRGNQGNLCAEFCAKNLHSKLLRKFGAFRGYWDDQRLQLTMVETVQEVDVEFLAQNPTVLDGCSAVVVLQLGQRMVVASIGDIASLMCKQTGARLC